MKLGHRVEIDDAEHASHEPAFREDDREPELALRQLLGQLEQQAHADAVDVGGAGEVDHEAQVLVPDGAEEALAQRIGLHDVDLADEGHDAHAAVVAHARAGTAVHAASSTPIRRVSSTVVPSPVRTTSTPSVSPSISSSPRPRCVPRGARQCPKSLISTVTVSWPSVAAWSSTTPGASPYACSIELAAASAAASVRSSTSRRVAPCSSSQRPSRRRRPGIDSTSAGKRATSVSASGIARTMTRAASSVPG